MTESDNFADCCLYSLAWFSLSAVQFHSFFVSPGSGSGTVRAIPSLGSQWMRLRAWGGVSSPTTNTGHWYFTPAHACTQLQHWHDTLSMDQRAWMEDSWVPIWSLVLHTALYLTFSFGRPFLQTSNHNHTTPLSSYQWFPKVSLHQGLYRDVKTSSNSKRIEYYDVSLNQLSTASHSHTCHDSSVTETSLPYMLSAIYILHGRYLALFNSHPKLKFFVWASFHVPVKSLAYMENSFTGVLGSSEMYVTKT